jgi:hypothetical protein
MENKNRGSTTDLQWSSVQYHGLIITVYEMVHFSYN